MNRRGFLALSGLTVAAAGADDVARLLAQARTAATGAVVETTAGRIRGSIDRGVHGGIDASVVPWMKERGVALTIGIARVPDDPHGDHRLRLVAAGIFLLDSPDLATLAATAARLNRWEFMLTLAPPRAPGASGYPVNPLAMF